MIRKARTGEARTLHQIVAEHARKGEMLPRSLSDIYEKIRDFYVFVVDGEVVGASALNIVWEDLAEVRSLVVKDGFEGRGIGTKLVEACLSEAIILDIGKVFALTYRPAFFERVGFRQVDKSELPHKIWGDCIKCSKFPDCDETALVVDLSGKKSTGAGEAS